MLFLSGCSCSSGGKQADKSELLALHSRLHLGMSQEEVEQACHDVSSGRLTLWQEEEALLRIATPANFSATNWVLWLSFSDEDRLTAMRIRTLDVSSAIPLSAPKDILAENAVCPPWLEPRHTYSEKQGYIEMR